LVQTLVSEIRVTSKSDLPWEDFQDKTNLDKEERDVS